MSEINKLVIAWIEKADHDLGSAKLIYLHIPQQIRLFTVQTIGLKD